MAVNYCPNGHYLQRGIRPDNWCDGCEFQGTSYYCVSGCDYDLCDRCFAAPATTSAPARIRCQNGHELASCSRPMNYCDFCHQMGTTWACHLSCDFDVCAKCYSMSPAEVENVVRTGLDSAGSENECDPMGTHPLHQPGGLVGDKGHAELRAPIEQQPPVGEVPTENLARNGGHMSNDFCEVCQKAGKLLLCDFCPRAFHVRCVERFVESETLTGCSEYKCPVCIYGVEVLRGDVGPKLSKAEMEEMMALHQRRSKQQQRASQSRRDAFLQLSADLVEPFASKTVFRRIVARERRSLIPLEIGVRVTAGGVDGFAYRTDAIVLAQSGTTRYVVGDPRSGRELEAPRDMLAPAPPQSGEGPANFLKFARSNILAEGIKLKGYQALGVNWLVHMWHNRCGGILGDDMGLGKTIQTLSFLSYLRASGVQGPFLVICPLSCTGNWMREAKRFVPHLTVAKLCGGAKEREYSLDDDEIWYGMKDIIISTYEVVVSTIDYFERHLWPCMVLDEAHRIKGQGTQVRQSLDKVSCAGRVLLTGTPLQNNLGELFNILCFLWPDVLGDGSAFESAITMQVPLAQVPGVAGASAQEVLGTSVDQGKVDKIRALLSTLMLRRTKEEVLTLPPKIFYDIWLPFSPCQAVWYRDLLKTRKFLQAGGTRKLMKLLTRIRQLGGHPRGIVKDAKDKEELKALPGIDGKKLDELLEGDGLNEEFIAQSGKMVFLDKLLGHLHAQNMAFSAEWRKAWEDRQKKMGRQQRSLSASLWLRNSEGLLFLDNMKPHKVEEKQPSPSMDASPQQPGDGAALAGPAGAGPAGVGETNQGETPNAGTDNAAASPPPEVLPRPHKVLIFSQFHSCMDSLEIFCKHRGWRYLRMDGSTARVLRELDMRDFNSDDEDYFIYLIGTRSGGLGINLAMANHVVLFDQDWNPHVDFQAIDRAHRIGQQRIVTVYRLVTEWGVEEKLVHRQSQKLEMEKTLISHEIPGEGLEDGEGGVGPRERLSMEEVLAMLQYGDDAIRRFPGESMIGATLQELLSRPRKPLPKPDPEALAALEAEAMATMRALPNSGELVDVYEDGASHQANDEPDQGAPADAEVAFLPPPPVPVAGVGRRQALQPNKNGAVARTSSGRTIRKPTNAYAMMEKHLQDERDKPRKVKEIIKHYDECFSCNLGPKWLPRGKGGRRRGIMDKELAADSPVGPCDVLCEVCPKAFHSHCIGVGRPGGRWVCGWHSCSTCNRNASSVGGMLIVCLHCPTALCHDCFPPSFRRVHPSVTFWNDVNQRGWKVTDKKVVFFTCNACRALEEQKKRQEMRAEDLEAQQDDKKRAALEEKRSLAVKKKEREDEEARRRMRQIMVEHERSDLSHKYQSARDNLQRAAEYFWPPLFRARWLSRCDMKDAKAPQLQNRSDRSKQNVRARGVWSILDRSSFQACSNCGFPCHVAEVCPYPAEKVPPNSASKHQAEKEDDDDVKVIEDDGPKSSRLKRCSICASCSHGRVLCGQLSPEQRTEYLDRVDKLSKLSAVFAELGVGLAPPEPLLKTVAEQDDAGSPELLAARRDVQLHIETQVKRVLEERDFSHLIIAPPPPLEPKQKPKSKAKPKMRPGALDEPGPRGADMGVDQTKTGKRQAESTAGPPVKAPRRKTEPGSKTSIAPIVQLPGNSGRLDEDRMLVDGVAAGWTISGVQPRRNGPIIFRYKPPNQNECLQFFQLKEMGYNKNMLGALADERKEMADRLSAQAASATGSAPPRGGRVTPPSISTIPPRQQESFALAREVIRGPASGWIIRGRVTKTNTIQWTYRAPTSTQWLTAARAAELTDQAAWDALVGERGRIGRTLREHMSRMPTAAPEQVKPQPVAGGHDPMPPVQIVDDGEAGDEGEGEGEEEEEREYEQEVEADIAVDDAARLPSDIEQNLPAQAKVATSAALNKSLVISGKAGKETINTVPLKRTRSDMEAAAEVAGVAAKDDRLGRANEEQADAEEV